MAKLRSGQRWLIKHWVESQATEASERDQTFFDETMFAWDEMERELRELGYKGCPVGEGGCHPDAPVICEHCSSLPRQSSVEESNRPGAQGLLFKIGRQH